MITVSSLTLGIDRKFNHDSRCPNNCKEENIICMQTVCGHTPTHNESWTVNGPSKFIDTNK
jgi:hypothetical protein